MSRADITLTVNPGRTGTARSSDQSASFEDEDSSSGTGVHLSPSLGSQESSDREYSEEYEVDSWEQLSKADVGPSESASRPSTSNHHRIAEAAHRHHSRREASHNRLPHRPSRPHHPQASSPGSVGSHEELLAYGPDLPQRRGRPYSHWALAAGGQNPQYAPTYSTQGYNPYPPSSGVPPGQQMIPFSNQTSQYPYSPYQQQSLGNNPGYFGHGPVTGHHGIPGSIGAPIPQSGNHYAQDMMHPTTVPAYYPYPQQPYPMPHPVAPSPVYQHYQPVYTPPPPAGQTSPTAQPEAPRDDNWAELKQMLITEKVEREAREAAEKDRIAAAEAAKAKADEIATAAAEAAKAATTEAEKKAAAEKEEAATKAKEAADKAKAEADEATAKLKEAEEAAAKAKEEKEAAIAAAAALVPPEEKKKPIKFKDAVGRKFSFPFHLCSTWEGMEDLIRQAFLHVDIIGPHVVEGHYDLIGPNSEIILPGVWETVIEPDWTITMHMWPMPEPKLEDPDAVIQVPEPAAAPPPEKKGKNKRRVTPAVPAVDVPPPPPPLPLAPDGVIDAQAGPKNKKAPPRPFWFGAARPRPKPKQLVKK